MKRYVPYALAIAAVVTCALLATLAIQKYQNYKPIKERQEQAVAQAKAKQTADDIAHEQKRVQALVETYNKLQAECKKGEAAYEQVPAALKTKLAEPNCGLELLQ